MRLLLDNNLSPRLADRLEDAFPGATHVERVGLGTADDVAVWQYASRHGYTIVSKDSDFNDMVHVKGFPPRVVWLRLGNCRTADVEAALRKHRDDILALDEDAATGILVISRSPGRTH